MSKLNNRLLTFALLLLIPLIVATLAMNGAVRAVAQTATQNVFVTNTAARAVNTVVRNSAAAPVWTRDVDEARQPVQGRLTAGWNVGQGVIEQAFYEVPAGKRLVIEYVSGYGTVPTDQGVVTSAVLTELESASYTPHYINPDWRGHYNSLQYYTASEDTRIYANPGTTVIAYIRRSSTSGTGSWDYAFSGYLVNVP